MNDAVETKSLKRLAVVFVLLGLGLVVLVTAGAMTWSTGFGLGLVVAALLIWTAFQHQADIEAARRDALSGLRARLRETTVKPSVMRAHIVEGISVPLLLLDPDTRVLEANRAARDLLGEKIVGKDLTMYLRQPSVLDALEKATEQGLATQFDLELVNDTPRTYTVGVSTVTNQDAQQRADLGIATGEEPKSFIVVSMIDITKLKTAEGMRADFVANSSHELRTPLSSLIGFIETLQGPARGDVEASDRFLAIMADEADRMIRLIDDLLSLSRIELDRHVRPETAIALPPIIERVVSTLASSAEKRGITLATEADEYLPTVQGDQDQIIQVVQNLVSNAIKYTRENTQVTIRMQRADRIPEVGGPGIRLDVIDQGEGIAPEHLPRLTERFYRVDTARSRKMGGTGLGLAIVKHIVSRHRGHLAVTSKIGSGSTFSIWLPLSSDASRMEPEKSQPQAISA